MLFLLNGQFIFIFKSNDARSLESDRNIFFMFCEKLEDLVFPKDSQVPYSFTTDVYGLNMIDIDCKTIT
jgi:hypothetical protein